MSKIVRTALALGAGAALAAGLAACSSDKPHAAGSGSSEAATVSGSAPGSSAPASVSRGPSSSHAGTSSPDTGPHGGPVPKGFVPTSTTFVSPTHGWVLGTAPCSTQPCTSIVRTSDGGTSWTGIPAPKATLGDPNSSRGGGVAMLRFADDSNGWAGVGDLYSTHDGGATWHKQNTSAFNGRVRGLGTGGGYVYVYVYNCPSQGGNSCSNTSRVYASPVGRDAWTPVTGTVPGGSFNTALTVQGGTWFLPTPSGIWRGSGTRAGVKVANPCRTSSAGLAAADVNHLDAMCVSGGAAGSAQYQLYGTTDGGHTWRAAGPAHREPSGLSGMADNTKGVLLVATQSGASVILRTTNDGGSYQHAAVSAPSGGYPWNDLGFTTQTQAAVVMPQHGMYLSHDAGRTFTPVRF